MPRPIAILTHVADQRNIANANFLSLLRIRYAAPQDVMTMEPLSSDVESYVYIERNMELFPSPIYTQQVPNELVIVFSCRLVILA